MKRFRIKIINFLNSSYFSELDYDELEKWGIEDVHNGVIIFKD